MGQSGENTPLTRFSAVSPLDGRYWREAQELSPYFSEEALIRTRVEVEARYLIALSDATTRDGSPANLLRPTSLEPKERETLLSLGQNLTGEQIERIKAIEDTTHHDVKAMERGIREVLAGTSLEDVTEMIHFALTSEDVNNLAYRLLLERAREQVLVPAISHVVQELAKTAEEHKATPMLARTHGQPAVPTTLGKEMANFAYRLHSRMKVLEAVPLIGKLNGAVGNFNAHMLAAPEVDWIEFSDTFVRSLGFEPQPATTQINPPDDIIQLLHAFQGVNYAIKDIDQDMWRYISDGWFVQRVQQGEVGSSTMPQKVNPTQFENSEGRIINVNGWINGIIDGLGDSRLQRDLRGSTVMRNVGPALTECLLAYRSTLDGLHRASPNLEILLEDLHADWSILTEGVQTVLRRSRTSDPYSLVAGLSRGRKISAEDWQAFIDQLPQDALSEADRETLRALSPTTYLGEAERLTEMILEQIAA